MILLILFFIRSLLLIGNFFGQYVSIHKTESLLRAELDKLDYENVTDICRRLPDKNPLPVVSYIRKLIDAQNSPAHMQKLLDEDAEKIKKALCTLFVNDESSARPAGTCEVCRVYWWKHAEKMPKETSAMIQR